MRYSTSFLLTLAATLTSAYDVPASLQTFYNNVKSGGCTSYLDGNSNLGDGQGNTGFGFCTETNGALYVTGKNELSDMDVDCDGAATCGGDGDFQGGTAFDDTLQSDGYGIQTLDAGIHTFVVLGTCDVAVDTGSGGPVPPLSVVAVVCNNQLHYGVFGDTNGCDDDNFTGEASISLAQLCFPNDGLDGDNGHTDHDVLYLAFTSDKAVPGPNGADWKATDSASFEASLKSLGDEMIAGLLGGSSSSLGSNSSVTATVIPTTLATSTKAAATTAAASCSWSGHCAGASCSSDDDCSDDLVCNSGKCAN